MRNFIVFTFILFLFSFLQAQTKPAEQYADIGNPKVELTSPYLFQIKTHDNKLYYCHEIEPYDDATAVMITYKNITDEKGCRTLSLKTFVPLGNIKAVNPLREAPKAKQPDSKCAPNNSSKSSSYNNSSISTQMGLPKIAIDLADGALGQVAPNRSHVSGLLIYTDSVNTNTKYGMYGSLLEAQTDGFTATSTGDYIPVAHYHIKEFFRLNPNGELHVLVTPFNDTAPFAEMLTLQTAARDEIRQFGIHAQKAIATMQADVAAIQGQLDTLEALFTPAVAVVGFQDQPAIGSLVSMSTNAQSKNVAVMIGAIYGDNTVVGSAAYLKDDYLATQLSLTETNVPYIGAALGALSKAAIHENIGWVREFNMTKGAAETATISLADGTELSTLSYSTQETLNDKAYMFLRTFPNYPGAYINTDVTTAQATSDYNSLRNNRVINEAIRNLHASYLPYINAPLQLAPTGKMSANTVATYEGIGNIALDSLFSQGNLSQYKCYVNPDQNVLSTNKVIVQARIIPIGCSAFIDINLGFAPTLV